MKNELSREEILRKISDLAKKIQATDYNDDQESKDEYIKLISKFNQLQANISYSKAQELDPYDLAYKKLTYFVEYNDYIIDYDPSEDYVEMLKLSYDYLESLIDEKFKESEKGIIFQKEFNRLAQETINKLLDDEDEEYDDEDEEIIDLKLTDYTKFKIIEKNRNFITLQNFNEENYRFKIEYRTYIVSKGVYYLLRPTNNYDIFNLKDIICFKEDHNTLSIIYNAKESYEIFKEYEKE